MAGGVTWVSVTDSELVGPGLVPQAQQYPVPFHGYEVENHLILWVTEELGPDPEESGGLSLS